MATSSILPFNVGAKKSSLVPYQVGKMKSSVIPFEISRNKTKLSQIAPGAASGQNRKETNTFWMIPVLAAAFVLLAAFILVYNMRVKEFSDKISGSWKRIETSGNSYYRLVLDISEDTIDYSFESTFVDTNIGDFEYEVKSPGVIKVNPGTLYESEIKIKFNDDETAMMMTPALTSTDSSEYWFK